MTDPIKLTDEVLRDIAIAFQVNAFDYEHNSYHKPTVERGRHIAAAIRALRDAAQKVCSYDYEGDWPDQYDASRAIDALAALLPDSEVQP